VFFVSFFNIFPKLGDFRDDWHRTAQNFNPKTGDLINRDVNIGFGVSLYEDLRCHCPLLDFVYSSYEDCSYVAGKLIDKTYFP